MKFQNLFNISFFLIGFLIIFSCVKKKDTANLLSYLNNYNSILSDKIIKEFETEIKNIESKNVDFLIIEEFNDSLLFDKVDLLNISRAIKDRGNFNININSFQSDSILYNYKVVSIDSLNSSIEKSFINYVKQNNSTNVFEIYIPKKLDDDNLIKTLMILKKISISINRVRDKISKEKFQVSYKDLEDSLKLPIKEKTLKLFYIFEKIN